jgi:hypothetical protein
VNISEQEQEAFWNTFKKARIEYLVLQGIEDSEACQFAHTEIETRKFLGGDDFSRSVFVKSKVVYGVDLTVYIAFETSDIFGGYYLVEIDACNELLS